jgi:hypothetical protein
MSAPSWPMPQKSSACSRAAYTPKRMRSRAPYFLAQRVARASICLRGMGKMQRAERLLAGRPRFAALICRSQAARAHCVPISRAG